VVRRQAGEAVFYRNISPNPSHCKPWLTFDLDHVDSIGVIERSGLPEPTYVAINRINGHAHAGYQLESPVHFHEKAKTKPQQWLLAIDRAVIEIERAKYWSFDGQTLTLQSTTSNNVVQYPVTVTLDDPPAGVRLGASATVSITTGQADSTLLVTSSAVTTVGQRHTVTVLRGGQQSVVPVEVGLVGDNGTQIMSGLSAGDTVVLPSSSTTTGGGFPGFGGVGGLGGR